MRSIFKNVLLGSLIFTMPMMGFAEEIKPFKYIKNEDSYPKNIGLYKINTGNNWLFINQKPFHIDNQTKDVNFKGEIDAQCEDLEKVYKKNSKVFVITSTCWVWYGAKSSQKDYFIYEFNSSAKLVKTITISFDDEDREIYIKENDAGFRIESNKSKRTGKKYIYEYKNGKLYDYSTKMNPIVVAKESERVCKSFFEVFKNANKEQNLTGDLYYILSSIEYSQVSHKVKTDDFLSDQLASLIKVATVNQRKNMNYNQFKDKYCD